MTQPHQQSPEALFPDEFKRPTLGMGPFEAPALQRNLDIVRAAPAGHQMDWSRWFGAGEAFTLTLSGREAIGFALDDLALPRDAEVLIVTTTGGPYISACVTETIEARCRWSRTPGPATRAILVIHEFGFPAALPPELTAMGLPIIEDVAYALGSQTPDGRVGRMGDYIVYSFPKSMPLSFGGLLKSPRPVAGVGTLSDQARRELPILVDHYMGGIEAAYARRRELYGLYTERFADVGFSPLLRLEPGIVPHAFIIALPDQARATAMKPRLHEVGVISSVYYGGGGYFLPNHQELSDAAVEYIVANFAAVHEATA
ncbi:MAG: DegT/DnrJ/EryC1/StrS aminotransferase family protein [Proteobacteria bacterium]|nr:DegT/DnrJ/EryC1/StrS aminotransferase family protein [Pseudomonadota bacterium]